MMSGVRAATACCCRQGISCKPDEKHREEEQQEALQYYNGRALERHGQNSGTSEEGFVELYLNLDYKEFIK